MSRLPIEKTERRRLSLNMNTLDVMSLMSEGNPGGLRVLADLQQTSEPTEFMMKILLNLDDMNIRGSQLWVAFKDYCKEDISALKKAIIDRDPQMIEKINQEAWGTPENPAETAVQRGASDHHR